jgi:hypothetical protein
LTHGVRRRRLVEGLQMYGDGWPAVAEHVGTHSVIECITHFLALPIEDDFVDELERTTARQPGRPDEGAGGGSAEGRAAGQRLEGPGGGSDGDGVGRVPLAGAPGAPGNPLMSLVGASRARRAARVPGRTCALLHKAADAAHAPRAQRTRSAYSAWRL